jgi:uncharacterized protein (DUF427 family)
MARAMWNGEVIAESDTYEKVEGNVYFPPEAIKREYLRLSERTSICGWKGTARYYDVVVAGETNPSAAWYYPQPKDAAAGIKDHVAFWNGVEVDA